MSQFGDAAYQCLKDRITRAMEKGDPQLVGGIRKALLVKLEYCEKFGYASPARNVKTQIQRIDYWLEDQTMESMIRKDFPISNLTDDPPQAGG